MKKKDFLMFFQNIAIAIAIRQLPAAGGTGWTAGPGDSRERRRHEAVVSE
jgi:hypothetical protein